MGLKVCRVGFGFTASGFSALGLGFRGDVVAGAFGGYLAGTDIAGDVVFCCFWRLLIGFL